MKHHQNSIKLSSFSRYSTACRNSGLLPTPQIQIRGENWCNLKVNHKFPPLVCGNHLYTYNGFEQPPAVRKTNLRSSLDSLRAHPSASDTPPSSSPVQLPIAASLRLGCSETIFGSEKIPHANLRDLSARPERMAEARLALLGSKFHPLIMIHQLGYTTEDYRKLLYIYYIYIYIYTYI
jgi:hypothetical protein